MSRFYLRKEKRGEFGALVYGRSHDLKSDEALDSRLKRKLERGDRVNGDYFPKIAKAVGWKGNISEFVGAFFIAEEMWEEQERAHKKERYKHFNDIILDMSRKLEEKPYLYKFLYSNKPLSSDDPDFYNVAVYIEVLLTIQRDLVLSKDDLLEEDYDFFLSNMVRTYENSPIVREYVKDLMHNKPILEAINDFKKQHPDAEYTLSTSHAQSRDPEQRKMQEQLLEKGQKLEYDFFKENPELRPFLFEEKPFEKVSDEKTRNQFIIFIEALLVSHKELLANRFNLFEDDWLEWVESAFVFYYDHSEVYRDLVEGRLNGMEGDTYYRALRDVIHEYKADLSRAHPDKEV